MRELLRRDRDVVFEMERLEEFSRLLGIANAVTAYEYLKEGETDGIAGWEQFEELPADTIAREKQAAQEKRREIQAEKKRLKTTGLLLAEVVKKDSTLQACSVERGFVASWSSFAAGVCESALELYASPWKKPEVVPLDLTPQVNGAASDAAGTRLTFALGKRVVVCAGPDWRILCEVQESDWAIAVALSADGRLVAHSSRKELVLTEVDTGARVRSLPGECREMAFHPSGRWLVAATHDRRLGIADLDQPTEGGWRELVVGADRTASTKPITERFQSLDLAELEQQQRALLESIVQSKIESWAQEHGTQIPDTIVQPVREEIDKNLKTFMSGIQAIRSAQPVSPDFHESPMSLMFTRDGQWLCCGTDKGLRVYSWSAVAAAEGGELPRPKWRHDTESYDQLGLQSGYVYAIAQEVDGTGVLFGGLTGQLFRMDLESGAVRRLLTMPERTSIVRLTMSRDGQALGVVSFPRALEPRQAGHDRRSLWSIWSYPNLLAGGAEH